MASISCALNRSEKVDGGGLCLEDKISGLPDAILFSILSLLTMKEAAKTCVLSKTWWYVWTYRNVLNFDASHIIDEIKKGDKEVLVERPFYLNWVNQVVKSYKGTSIEEFRVKFDLDATCKLDLDNWVHFVMEKRVKRLELNLVQWREPSLRYSFPGNPIGFTSCRSLTNLLLKHVNVSGQVLEYFLTNCPFLENLSVEASQWLVNLTVPRQALKLKRLEIMNCFSIECIEIYATNLASFKYCGRKISLPFKDLKQSIELFIGGLYCNYLIYDLCGISSYCCQLEMLTLSMPSMPFMEDGLGSANFPVFNKLKHLELRIDARDDESLLVFAPLIEACPFLHKFVLQLEWSKWPYKPRRQKIRSLPHQFLKVVELIGWVGRRNDFDLAVYLVRSAVTLEKMTLDSRSPLHIGTPWEFMETDEKTAARKRAEYFRAKLPVGVDLRIV